METQATTGGAPKHSSAYLRNRQFLLIVPLLILPFLTMAFWSLGGGKQNSYPGGTQAAKGINFSLPRAQFKDQQAQDKMGIYQTAKAGLTAGDGVSEDFVRSMGGEQLHKPGDSARISSLSNNSGPSQADLNETRIREKIAAISQQVGKQDPQDDFRTYGGEETGPEVRKMQMMMKAMNAGSGQNDPEMKQLTNMLQQISSIQNPGSENNSARSQSLKNHGRVYPVVVAKDDSDDSETGQMKISYAADKGMQNPPQRQSLENRDTPGNTIPAVVHEDQTLVSGAVIKLRLTSAVYIDGKLIPKGSFVYGTCALDNERLIVKINSIRYLNNILPVALSVYDLDGMEGLYVPGSMGRDAAKSGIGDAVSSMQMLSMDQSVSAQAASAGVEAAKGLLNRKVKQVKVKVKAGYQVLLKDTNDRNN